MLSYQHSYHAGNLADVHKHAELVSIFKYLTKKEKPLTYIETHAGRGIYDLNCADSEKTGEAEHGIELVLKNEKINKSHPYFELINKIRDEVGDTIYPGSPFISEAMLRSIDTLHFMELHPGEYKELYHYMRYPNTHLHFRDGIEGALAICPPQIKRGMVFIDPSYEMKNEYEDIAKAVLKLHKKWETGIICVWLPILKENYHEKFFEIVEKSELSKEDCLTSLVKFKHPYTALQGSAMFLINPPFQIQEDFKEIENWFNII
ncbi:MAG: 23S rRNA (adenine(2030)-N(6))-methyltransferase RlmJ [Alphaproteobacteria bacterium]|nr:23S rRNA (adenine(2030)-N(6))-methyltransferase RlmJ [Alphaproteobacteria bacterium]